MLFARVGTAYSYNTGEKMVKYTDKQILKLIQKEFRGKSINILAPIVKARKGHYKELFAQIVRKGFLNVRVDEQIMEISPGLKLDRDKTHDIEIVIDRLKAHKENEKRMLNSLQQALKDGDFLIAILIPNTSDITL